MSSICLLFVDRLVDRFDLAVQLAFSSSLSPCSCQSSFGDVLPCGGFGRAVIRTLSGKHEEIAGRPAFAGHLPNFHSET